MSLRGSTSRWGHRQQPVAPARLGSTTLLAAMGALLALLGGGILALTAGTPTGVNLGVIPAVDMGRGAAVGQPGPGPLAVEIPSLDIDAPITPVHTAPSGELGVPASYTAAGWWGGRPGIDPTTPVILVGHVDDQHGPAVFYRIPQLLPGAGITLTAPDGTHLRYVVDAIRQYPDARFPAQLVYGSTVRPTLRLITCSGFSWWRRHYEDNTVVFAHLLT